MHSLTCPCRVDQRNGTDDRELLTAQLRRTQEALADQLIERRLDQERIAAMKLRIQDLQEQVGALRRALDSSKAKEPGSLARRRPQVRKPPRR